MQTAQKSLVNITAPNPYGDKIGKALQQETQNNKPKAISVAAPKKKVSLTSAHKAAPLFSPKRVASPKAAIPVRGEIAAAPKKTETVFTPDVEQAILKSDIFAPRSDFRKLVVQGSSEPNTGLLTYDSKDSPKKVSLSADKTESPQKPALEYNAEKEVDDEGYWTLPPLSELKKKPLGELRKIDNFTVGRKHYGEIKFLKPVDLSGFNLDDICGNIIVFGARNVIVYPDDDQPQRGEGFNLPAEVTLEGCYPINKKTKLAILDPKDEIVKKHIEKLKSLKEMSFKNYDPNTGFWTFSYEHV